MKYKKQLLRLVPLIIFLLTWEYFSLEKRNLFLFASPSSVFDSLVENLYNGILIKDFLITSFEIIVGFLIGNILGSLIGLSLWFSQSITYILKPYILILGSIPIFAISPMIIMWFGTDLYAKIMIVVFSTILVAIMQSYEGATNVNNEQIKLLKSFGASNFQIFNKLIIPSSLIWLVNSFKLNIFYAISGAFIGEFISAEAGLGYRVLKATALYDIPFALASIFLFILLAFSLNTIIDLIKKKYLKKYY